MRNQNILVLNQLDHRLAPLHTLRSTQVPKGGWLRAIRNTLNLSLQQIGNKLGMTAQGVKNIEVREAQKSVSIKTMHEVAEALDLQFIYGFIPKKGNYEDMVEQRATALAKKIILRTHQTMRLENQGIPDEIIQKAIEELAYDLKRELKREIWD